MTQTRETHHFGATSRARRLARAACAALLLTAMAAGCDDTPTNPSTNPTTATIFYASRLARGGAAWRSFTTRIGGSVTVQLTSLLPQTGVAVSLGLGTFDGTNCTLTKSVETAPGAEPQMTETLAAGNYCVRIADIGNLSGNNDFTISVVIPLPPD